MKRLVAILAVLAAVTVGLFLAVPPLAGMLITDALRGLGAERVELGEVRLNPLTGRMVLRDVVVEGGGVERVALSRLEVAPHLLLLLHRQAYLTTLEGDGLEVVLELEPRDGEDPGRPLGAVVGGLLDQWDAVAESPWDFGSLRMAFKDLRLRLVGADQEVVIEVERLLVEGLETWPDPHAARLDLAARVNGVAVTATGSLRPFAATPQVVLEVSSEGIDLAPLLRLTGPAPVLEGGRLRIESRFTLSRPETDRVDLAQDGELALAGPAARGGRAERLAWRGELRAALVRDTGLDGFGVAGRLEGAALAGAGAGLEGLTWKGGLSGARGDGAAFRVSGEHAVVAQGLVTGETGALLRLEALEAQGSGAVTVGPGTGAAGHFEGRVSAGPLALEGGTGARAGDLRWDGKVLLEGDSPGAVTARGTFETGAIEVTGSGLAGGLEAFAWDGELRWRPGAAGGGSLSQEGRATARGASASLAATTLDADRLVWNGSLNAVLGEQGVREVSGSGELEGERLVAGDPAFRVQSLRWEGEAGVAGLEGDPEPSARGLLTGEQVELERLPGLTGRHRLEGLRLEGVRVEGPGQAGAERLVVNGIVLAGDREGAADPLLESTRAVVEGARLDTGTVRVARVAVYELEGLVVRREDGSLAGLAPETNDSPARTGASPLAGVTVERLQVEPGARLVFRDESVSPTFRETLALRELWVEGLAWPATGEPSPARLEGTLGRYGRVALDGRLQPFAQPLQIAVEGELEQLGLPPLSAYTAPALGYDLTAGQMDAAIDFNLEGTEITSLNQLTLRGLEVEPLDAEAMAELRAELSMPLDGALDMLRDGNNVIRLELPVSGDLRNPRFDLGDAINQAVGSAVKKGALTYLSLTLQPFGTLIAIAQLAGSADSAVALDPIRFAPGTREWAVSTPEYAERLSELLRERPELRLKLCAVAVAQDREALLEGARGQPAESKPGAAADPPEQADLQPALEALARGRAERVKDLLLEQPEVSADRLLVCKPRVSDEADTEPRVDIAL